MTDRKQRLKTSTLPVPIDSSAASPNADGMAVASANDPEALYAEILGRTTDARKRRSLENVRRALEMMREQKAREYTVAGVARTIQALDMRGPKEQTIRNVEGQDYRDLIRAYDGLHGRKEGEKAGAAVDELIAGISDQRTAAQVRWLAVENRSLKRRLDLLHHAFTNLEALSLLPDGSLDERATEALPDGRGLPVLSTRELGALRAFLRNLHELDCALDPDTGALLHRSGLEVAGPGFEQALRKITAEESNELEEVSDE